MPRRVSGYRKYSFNTVFIYCYCFAHMTTKIKLRTGIEASCLLTFRTVCILSHSYLCHVNVTESKVWLLAALKSVTERQGWWIAGRFIQNSSLQGRHTRRSRTKKKGGWPGEFLGDEVWRRKKRRCFP